MGNELIVIFAEFLSNKFVVGDLFIPEQRKADIAMQMSDAAPSLPPSNIDRDLSDSSAWLSVFKKQLFCFLQAASKKTDQSASYDWA